MRVHSSLKACLAVLGLVASLTWVSGEARSWADVVCDNADIAPDTFIAESRAASAVQCLINAERKARNLEPLTRYVSMGRPGHPTIRSAWSVLGVAATQQADDGARLRWWVKGADPHTNPQTQSTPASRAAAAGYCKGHTLGTLSENAYTGAGVTQNYDFKPFGPGDKVYTPRAAFRWWMWSKPHREAMLNPNAKQIAVGVATGCANRDAGDIKPAGTYIGLFATCT